MTGDWELSAAGTVTHLEQQDRDKTGRGLKVTYVFRVKPESLQAGRPEAQLDPEIVFRILDKDLAKLGVEPPRVGERVALTGRGNGPRPDSFYLTSLRRLQ